MASRTDRVTDLTPREEELVALLHEPMTSKDLAAAMQTTKAGILTLVWSLKRKGRQITTCFRYGSTTYQLLSGQERS